MLKPKKYIKNNKLENGFLGGVYANPGRLLPPLIKPNANFNDDLFNDSSILEGFRSIYQISGPKKIFKVASRR